MSFSNPGLYLVIINLAALIWAIRSWRKGVYEKWMNSLRDAGSELIGAAEHVYGIQNSSDPQLPLAKASFIAREQKLILLFAHNKSEQTRFSELSEMLRSAAEQGDPGQYRDQVKCFSSAVGQRVYDEWKQIKSPA